MDSQAKSSKLTPRTLPPIIDLPTGYATIEGGYLTLVGSVDDAAATELTVDSARTLAAALTAWAEAQS